MSAASLGEQLAELSEMSLDQLRQRCSERTDKSVPKVSAGLLRLALAWDLQATAHGGLPRKIQQQLEQAASGKTSTRDASPGMRLVREWNGTVHVVTIDEDGTIHWNEQVWNSLSQVARAITGTRWSGPAFFGLKTKVAA